MSMTNIKVGDILEYQPIDNNMPVFFHNRKDAGYDLYITKTTWIWPFKINKVPVNMKIILPDNTFGLITGRSSTTEKSIMIVNGIIDETYRGTPHVEAYKIGLLPKRIKAGARIAQMIVSPYVEPNMVSSTISNDTARGDKGFVSTGGK